MNKFLPKLSKTDNDIAERDSILFLETILQRDDICTHFSVGDKTANTDGTIELLENRLVYGKIVVQIKTYPRKYQNKSKYDFPIEIFAYAQNVPTDFVLFFAVDKNENVVYWKHINRALIKKYENSYAQKHITIGFDDSEMLNIQNVDQVINKWKELYKEIADLVVLNEDINKENDRLRLLVQNTQNPSLSFEVNEIIKIQQFIDKYNSLLDNEYKMVKLHNYKKIWKFGIAIFKYETNQLSYIIYYVPYGSNDFLLKEISLEQLQKAPKSNLISSHNSRNYISENPEAYAFRIIQGYVRDILKNKNILFLTQEIANEYVVDFLNKEGHHLNLKESDALDLSSFKLLLEKNYPLINKKIPCSVVFGRHEIIVNLLYECICYLINRGSTKLQKFYPSKGHYGNTGSIYDWYTPELAFEKIKIAFEKLPHIFDAFMEVMFPALIGKIDLFDGCNILLVNLLYKQGSNPGEHQIELYYLYRIDGNSDSNEIIVSLNSNSEIYKQNNIENYNSMIGLFGSDETIIFRNSEYNLLKIEGYDISLLFGEYFIHNLLYKVLNDRFTEYFKICNEGLE